MCNDILRLLPPHRAREMPWSAPPGRARVTSLAGLPRCARSSCHDSVRAAVRGHDDPSVALWGPAPAAARWRSATGWAAIAQAHRSGSILALAEAKGSHLHAFVWRGELPEAEAEGREAVEACEACGSQWSFPAAYLADALIEQGKLDDAAAVLSRAGSELGPESGSVVFLRDSRARLRVLRGDIAGGLEELLEVGIIYEAIGGRNPGLISWRSGAALAHLRQGEREDARRLAEEEVALAQAWGAPRALSVALRARGLVEGGREGLVTLGEAVDVVADSPARLAHAQARTELGAALHRANRPRRRASNSGAAWSWRRSAGRRRSPRGRRPSSAPQVRAHDASRCKASSRSLPANGASPNSPPKARPTARSPRRSS